MNDSENAHLSTKYGVDYVDGKETPRLVITDDFTLTGVHEGGVHVEAGRFVLSGALQGSLDVQANVLATIAGTQQGSVSVARLAQVVVTGSLEGSLHVMGGGQVLVQEGGKLAGSLTNYGDVIVRGVFGGTMSGQPVRLEGNGYIKRPIVRDGVNYYEW